MHGREPISTPADAQPPLQGILNLDKPAGISSARAVNLVKRALPRRTKIGHAGTLDPFATGVLLLLIGRATKLCERLMDEPKAYEAELKLGATTATDDPESQEQPIGDPPIPTIDQAREAVGHFVGTILQTPPIYSAMKVQGRRAYDLARQGETVTLEPRPVRIDEIEVLAYEWPLLRIRVRCGRGTYIRSLARDIGIRLGSGAYLTALRRTAVGRFTAADAVSVDQVLDAGVRPLLSDL